MRVVMIGHEGVGKTTYMSSMYRVMSTEGIAGFWVRAATDSDHRRLLRAGQAVSHARYPPPSDHRAAFELTLRHQSSPLIEFTWTDFRGGVLRETTGQAQTDEFLADTQRADAALIFVDCADLLGPRTIARSRLRDLTNLTFRMLDKRDQLIPIVLVIAKSDIVGNDAEIPYESIAGFVDALSGDARVLGTVAPIACGPQPQGILLPVMFSLYFGLRARAAQLEANVVEAARQAQILQSNDSWYDRISSVVKGEPTFQQLARGAYAAAEAELEVLRPLIGPTQTLEQLLGETSVFGKALEDHAQ